MAFTYGTVNGMDDRQRHIRLSDERWAQLAIIAAAVVRDDEMPNGSKPSDPRTGAMLRLLADGKLSVVRVEDS
mgnify:CR=1 FL=1